MIARIVWKMAAVYEEDHLRVGEAKNFRFRAALARRALTKREADEDEDADDEMQEKSYDDLLPGYFR
jgi:hypothetical protein